MPSSAVRTFTDPDAYFGGIRNLQIDGLVVQGGEFGAKLTRIDLHRLFMCGFEESLPRVMKVTPSARRVGILFSTDPDQPTMLTNGMEISQGQIAEVGLHSEWYLRSSSACRWGTMSLAPGDLATAGETITGCELVAPIFARSVTPPPPALSRLRKLHAAARHLAKTVPDVLAKPEVAQAMEQNLVEAMAFCRAESHSTMCAMSGAGAQYSCSGWRKPCKPTPRGPYTFRSSVQRRGSPTQRCVGAVKSISAWVRKGTCCCDECTWRGGRCVGRTAKRRL